MCTIFSAWEALIAAGARMGPAASAADATESADGSTALSPEPFVYDLVNTGREVLNQLMLPTSQIFNMSLNDTEALNSTSQACKHIVPAQPSRDSCASGCTHYVRIGGWSLFSSSPTAQSSTHSFRLCRR